MRNLAWAYVIAAALLMISAISVGSFAGLLILLAGMALVIPPLWDRIGRQNGLGQAARRIFAPILMLLGAGFAYVASWHTPAGKAYAAELRRTGQACIPGGEHPDLVYSVKANLREPESFGHVRTTISPVKADGWHDLTMVYRARNGFGGVNVETLRVQVDSQTCNFSIVP